MNRKPPANARDRQNGFTLLELIVVVAVLGTVLVLTAPKLRLPGMHGDLDAVARQLIDTHRRLKAQAADRQQRHTLHIDLDRQRLWVSSAGMDEDQLAAAAEDGYDLPRDVRIRRVRTAGKETFAVGTRDVAYFPDGHSYLMEIDLSDSDGRSLTLRIEPFLPLARVVNADDMAAL